MRRTLTLSTCATLLALTGCASSTKPASSDATPAAPTAASTIAAAPAAPATVPVTATTAMVKLSALVPAAKLTATYTAANDPNHFLGRPHEYTSKVEFKDTRLKASDVQGEPAGGLQYGGSTEVFTSSADAAARSAYITAATASLPSEAEYDYIHGDVLIRVSHYLTPDQAKAYETAAQQLG